MVLANLLVLLGSSWGTSIVLLIWMSVMVNLWGFTKLNYLGIAWNGVGYMTLIMVIVSLLSLINKLVIEGLWVRLIGCLVMICGRKFFLIFYCFWSWRFIRSFTYGGLLFNTSQGEEAISICLAIALLRLILLRRLGRFGTPWSPSNLVIKYLRSYGYFRNTCDFVMVMVSRNVNYIILSTFAIDSGSIASLSWESGFGC